MKKLILTLTPLLSITLHAQNPTPVPTPTTAQKYADMYRWGQIVGPSPYVPPQTLREDGTRPLLEFFILKETTKK